MRGQGRIFKRPDSRYLWCAYSHDGACYRESTRETDEAKARRYLRQRLRQCGADKLGLKKFVSPQAEQVRMSELFDALRMDMKLRGLRSYAAAGNHADHAAAAFGHYRVRDITPALVDRWVENQLAVEAGPSPSTINRRLQMLRQALQLAVDRGQLAAVPRIRKLSELGRERQGFFEKAEFQAVVEHLPDDLQDFARFAYLTGWRKGSISSLQWADVDFQGRVVRLRPENDKTGSGQLLALEGELWDVIERRRALRTQNDSIVLHVFHRAGKPIGDFRKSWAAACEAAGLPAGTKEPGGKTFHDLRRTGVRNLIRAGVPERVAMSISGHKTRAVFDRYNIVSAEDMREAQAKLQEHLKGQGTERKVVELTTAR